MVSVHSLWKGYFDPGESGKRKNMACNGNRRILYEWKRTSQCTSYRRPMVALHWEKYMQHAREKYNREHLLQLPPITPHVCRHTYCTNMANSGMNPKTLQYLMGHSDISVTLNIYTHTGYDDAKKELSRLKEARDELEKKKFVTQKHAQITHVSLIS